MDEKERLWHIKKIGKFSASILDKLHSKSGEWIQGNKSLLYSIQRQRVKNEPPIPISAWAMKIGIENEPYAIAWFRKKHPKLIILHCESDFTEKIFEEPEKGLMYGASPDALIVSSADGFDFDSTTGKFIYNEKVKAKIIALLEIKCLTGGVDTDMLMSPTLPLSIKTKMVLSDHSDQLAGQLWAYPNVDKIYLLEYEPQLDENPWDLRDVLDEARGLEFEFTRSEMAFAIARNQNRVRFADAYLKSGKDLEKINETKINI